MKFFTEDKFNTNIIASIVPLKKENIPQPVKNVEPDISILKDQGEIKGDLESFQNQETPGSKTYL